MKTMLNVEKNSRGNRRIRVLLVDDAAVMRDVLAYFVAASPGLELAGCAHDGQEAVELAASLRPDLVLMDIHMPVMNGLDATRLIKQPPGAPLVVMLSTDGRAANRAGGLGCHPSLFTRETIRATAVPVSLSF